MKKIYDKLLAAMLSLSAAFFALALLFCSAPSDPAISPADAADGGVAEVIFTDYTRTVLKPAYDTEAELENYRRTLSDYDEAVFARAEDVIKGNVFYDPGREFSTAPDAAQPIEQLGNCSAYSTGTLKLYYSTSDLIMTGIYAKLNEPVTVYVEADGNALPGIAFTESYGSHKNYRVSYSLKRGVNSFTFAPPSYGGTWKNGGPVYLTNPYLPSQQGVVKVYIEGGGFFPALKKDGDEQAFLSHLAEFEERRKADADIPDVAELLTDHCLFTTTASSLYKTYIEFGAISPQKNLELWGDAMNKVLEFNGIPTDPVDSPYSQYYDPKIEGVRFNLRYVQSLRANTGAYATSKYIGFYNQHYFYADYMNYLAPMSPDSAYHTKDYDLFAATAHELGHVMDVTEKAMPETTNNMNATYAFLKIFGRAPLTSYQPFSRSTESLVADDGIDRNAFDNGRILYTTSDYDHNYMVWWFLESVFPGYWGRLNSIYRYANEASYLSNLEKMVYYSSLVTKTDLRDYFERWGLYMDKSQKTKFTRAGATSRFTQLMETACAEGRIDADAFTKYYYADESEYDYVSTHTDTGTGAYGDRPAIAAIYREGNSRILKIESARDESFLGYEIRVSADGNAYKVIGFSRSASFTDTAEYGAGDPYYQVVAVNRFFRTSLPSLPRSDVSGQMQGVCRVGSEYFKTFEEGIDAAKNARDKTLYLLDDCKLPNVAMQFYSSVKIAVDPNVRGDVTICTSGQSSYLGILGNVSIEGTKQARIVIDDLHISRFNALISVSSANELTLKYVSIVNNSTSGPFGTLEHTGTGKIVAEDCTFENCSARTAGAIKAVNGASVLLTRCKFIGNTQTDGAATRADGLRISGELTLEDVAFSGQTCDVCLEGSGASLKFVGGVPSMRIDTTEEKTFTFAAEGFIPSETDTEKLRFVKETFFAVADGDAIEAGPLSYTVTFRNADRSVEVVVHAKRFVLGEEDLSAFGAKKFAKSYQNAAGGAEYRRGEEIELSGDLTLDVVLCDKIAVTIAMLSGEQNYLLIEGERMRLPRFDGDGRTITGYTGKYGTYSPGESYVAVGDETITPMYLGYFHYEFLDRGISVGQGYATHGETVNAPDVGSSDLTGWLAATDGETFVRRGGTVKIERNVMFVSVYEDDLTDLTDAVITVLGGDIVYDGSAKTPPISVRAADGGEILPAYYAVSYENNVSAGVATVRIVGREGLSQGAAETSFTIGVRMLTVGSVTIEGNQGRTYSGEEQRADLTIRYGTKQLLRGVDYELTYPADLTRVGRKDVVVTLRGNYGGSFTVSYTIGKAQRPAYGGPTAVELERIEDLSSVSLPDGWAWQMPTEEGGAYSVYAEYVGSDADCYLETTVRVSVSISSSGGGTTPEPPEPEEGGGTSPEGGEGSEQGGADEPETGDVPEQGSADENGESDPDGSDHVLRNVLIGVIGGGAAVSLSAALAIVFIRRRRR